MKQKSLFTFFLGCFFYFNQSFCMNGIYEQRVPTIPDGDPTFLSRLNTGMESTDSHERKAEKSESKLNKKNIQDCPLHHLAFDGNDRLILAYLERNKYKVDECDEKDHTPLFWAVIGKKINTIKFLLDRGANPKLIYPAVEKYFAKGGYDEVKAVLALAKKGKLNEDSFKEIADSFISKNHLLFKYAKKGYHKELESYLNENNVNSKDSLGKTPLYYAILYNHFITVRVLLAHGADFDEVKKFPEINFPSIESYKNHAVFKLIKQGNYEELGHYLTKDNVNAKDAEYRVPLYYAILEDIPFECKFKMVKLILERGANYLQVSDFRQIRRYLIMDFGDKREVQRNKRKLAQLLAETEEADAEDIDTLSSLNDAIATNDPDIVEDYWNQTEWSEPHRNPAKRDRRLLSSLLFTLKTIDPEAEATNFRIDRADDYTAERYVQNLIQIIDFLLSKLITDYIGYRDRTGQNLLHLAVGRRKSSAAVMEHLISLGISYEVMDNEGFTPLARAVQMANISAIRVLVRHKANEKIKVVIKGKEKKLRSLAAENNVEKFFRSITRGKFVSRLGILLSGTLSAYLIFNKLFNDYKNRNRYV